MSWRRGQLAPISALLVLSAITVAAQRTLSTRSFQGLRLQVAQTDQMRGVIEVRARWSAISTQQRAAQPSLRDAFTVLDQRARPGGLRRERRPELNADRVVVISVDADGRELDWRIILNPRIVRAEVPGPGGRLSGGSFESADADLQFTIPDLPGTESVDIYRPVPARDGYSLSPLGSVQLRR